MVDPVADDDGPHGVGRIWYVDLQIDVGAVPAASHLQPLPPFVGDIVQAQSDAVGYAIGCAGFNRDEAMDAIPRAVEAEANRLRYLHG